MGVACLSNDMIISDCVRDGDGCERPTQRYGKGVGFGWIACSESGVEMLNVSGRYAPDCAVQPPAYALLVE